MSCWLLRRGKFCEAAWTALVLVLLGTESVLGSDGSTNGGRSLILTIGAPGEAEYGTNFVEQARQWEEACGKDQFRITRVGFDPSPETNDVELLRRALEAEPKTGDQCLWLVFIGHGSFNGKEAKFNLRGPDLSATELADWLKPFERPLAVVNAASCSAPFLKALSGTNRVIVTATRSGNEQYFTRFGLQLARALNDSSADLDKDQRVSLLEAFIIASRNTAEFYKQEDRLATEHALLDDNGDGLGTQGDWFRGLRAVKKPSDKAAVDGQVARHVHLALSKREEKLSAEQRVACDQLEETILLLRDSKNLIAAEEYDTRLEALLIRLARIYEAAGILGKD